MLDRLMRRPVLAEPDRIMRHDIDDAQPHHRREPDGRPAIIGEDQERAAIGDDAAMRRHAVHRRGHARARARRNGCSCRRNRRASRPSGPWPWCCWSRSDRPSRRPVRAVTGASASSTMPEDCRVAMLRRLGGEIGLARASSAAAASRGQHAGDAAREFAARVGVGGVEALAPGTGDARAARARLAPRVDHVVGHLERRMVQPSRARAPAISAAPRGAPCAAAVPALVGAPKAIDGAAGDERSAGRSRGRARSRRRSRRCRGRRPRRCPSRRRRSARARRRRSASAVAPSIEIWLSSHSTISRPRRRCPASEIASCDRPSMRQPSPAMT